MFFSVVIQLWTPPSSVTLPIALTRERKMRIFYLRCADPTFQLELLPSQKLFLAATSVKLSCRAPSSIDFVFSLKYTRLLRRQNVCSSLHEPEILGLPTRPCKFFFSLHSKVASLVLLCTDER